MRNTGWFESKRVGECVGGSGVGRFRCRISRNAPASWDLGAKEISVLFHDGRLSRADDHENRFNSPVVERLPKGLNSLLAAQALFPLTSRKVMAGDPKENWWHAQRLNVLIMYGQLLPPEYNKIANM